MLTLISFFVVLGVLIFIHELGHFAVAKFAGVGVEKFSLGFGKKIASFTRGETEYRVSILPLGGYVKMVGEAVGEEVSEEDKARSFTHKPLRSKAAIVIAGPVMNLVLAFVLLPIIFMIGIKAPAYLDRPAEVGFVVAGEAAEEAGLVMGDVIEEVNGSVVVKWEELVTTMALSPERELRLKVRRDGATLDKLLVPQSSKSGAGIGGFFPPMAPTVGSLSDGYPAKEAGLLVGDTIVSIDGNPVKHWVELEGAIHESGDKTAEFADEMSIMVEREGELLTFRVRPKLNADAGVYLIGVTRLEDTVMKRYGFIESIGQGMTTAVNMTVKLFVIIKGLIVGEFSLKTLGGPIMIAQVSGQAIESGITEFLFFVAFLSLQLGIINLFPIPVLDGGHLVFFAVETILGRPLNERVLSITQQVGMVLLIALMVFVTWNDIMRIIPWDKLSGLIG